MSFGQYIRSIREDKQLLLREVASQMNIDTALLSKIELGTRVARREHVEALASVLNVSKKELIKIWLADKIMILLKDETNKDEILKVAEDEIKYLRKK